MAPNKPSHAQRVGVGWGKTRKPQQGKHQTPRLHMRVWFTVASPGFQWGLGSRTSAVLSLEARRVLSWVALAMSHVLCISNTDGTLGCSLSPLHRSYSCIRGPLRMNWGEYFPKVALFKQ